MDALNQDDEQLLCRLAFDVIQPSNRDCSTMTKQPCRVLLHFALALSTDDSSISCHFFATIIFWLLLQSTSSIHSSTMSDNYDNINQDYVPSESTLFFQKYLKWHLNNKVLRATVEQADAHVTENLENLLIHRNINEAHTPAFLVVEAQFMNKIVFYETLAATFTARIEELELEKNALLMTCPPNLTIDTMFDMGVADLLAAEAAEAGFEEEHQE